MQQLRTGHTVFVRYAMRCYFSDLSTEAIKVGEGKDGRGGALGAGWPGLPGARRVRLGCVRKEGFQQRGWGSLFLGCWDGLRAREWIVG